MTLDLLCSEKWAGVKKEVLERVPKISSRLQFNLFQETTDWVLEQILSQNHLIRMENLHLSIMLGKMVKVMLGLMKN